MKVLYQWLREFVPMDISPQETADTLSRLGFEIAELKIFGGALKNVITAEVQECGKHPNADRLSLCKIFTGSETLQVVCGASNVRAGIKIAFAQVGATMPNGETLNAAKIRGVESFGMICSAAELGLEEKSDGIMILDPATPLGQDVRPLLGLDDALIDIEVTPNRRDVLGVLGVARELAAGLGLPLRIPEPRMRELELSNSVITVQNEVPALCPRYIARNIKNVKVGPSPEWMVRRLTRCGIRSINNLVDITNYVMLELGQPLHAFDAAKLEGKQIRVRAAREGETILTLESKTATLQPEMLVIADADRPVALAGIMGGEESAIQAGTQDIVLESAAFTPSSIRKTSKQLGIRSESSYRFERGSDLDMVAFASRRAAQLIQELAEGLGCKPIEASASPMAAAIIKMRTDRMREFLGADIKDAQAADILRKLGFVISSGTSQMAVTVPSWRLDLTMEADLYEEIARLYSYDQIPVQTPAVRISEIPTSSVWKLERQIAGFLTGLGYSEAMNYSYLSDAQRGAFGPGLGMPSDAKPVAIANPLSLEQAVLRPTLIPALIQNAQLNLNRRLPGVRLFEFGRVFYQDAAGPHEQRRLGLILAGETGSAAWNRPAVQADFYALSGLLSALTARQHIRCAPLSVLKHGAFHPRRSAMLTAGKNVLAWFGELHPSYRSQLGIKEPVVAAEIDLDGWQASLPGVSVYAPMVAFPPVMRDLSVIAPENMSYDKLAASIQQSAGSLLESCRLIDLFQGEKIGAGKKSMTFSFLFRTKERTLSDADIEKTMSKILSDLEKNCQTVIRS